MPNSTRGLYHYGFIISDELLGERVWKFGLRSLRNSCVGAGITGEVPEYHRPQHRKPNNLIANSGAPLHVKVLP
jgi:hypothetical protein